MAPPHKNRPNRPLPHKNRPNRPPPHKNRPNPPPLHKNRPNRPNRPLAAPLLASPSLDVLPLEPSFSALVSASQQAKRVRLHTTLTHARVTEKWSSDESPLLYFFCKTILAGKIIALETDTVPGLAVDALNPSALAQLYRLKQRQPHKPIVWVIDALGPLRPYIEYSALGEMLIKKYWPGALTIIFPLTPLGRQIVAPLTGTHTTLALRKPADHFLANALQLLKTPLAITSANYSAHEPAQTLSHVRKIFGSTLDAYLERNRAMSALASTIVDISSGAPVIKRQGNIQLHA